jgi:hypothetical protein
MPKMPRKKSSRSNLHEHPICHKTNAGDERKENLWMWIAHRCRYEIIPVYGTQLK